MPAVAAALAFAASSAATIPSTFFWFGQMMTQTLKAMISASHMPMPISRADVRSVSASGQTADVTYLHLKNWIEAIRNHRPAACNEDVGLREALTTHMGVLAYQWGCRVRWDPKRQKIVPDAAPSARS